MHLRESGKTTSDLLADSSSLVLGNSLGGSWDLADNGSDEAVGNGLLGGELLLDGSGLASLDDDGLLGDQVIDDLLGLAEEDLGWGEDVGGFDDAECCSGLDVACCGCDGGSDSGGLGFQFTGCGLDVGSVGKGEDGCIKGIEGGTDGCEAGCDGVLGKGAAEKAEESEGLELHFGWLLGLVSYRRGHG